MVELARNRRNRISIAIFAPPSVAAAAARDHSQRRRLRVAQFEQIQYSFIPIFRCSVFSSAIAFGARPVNSVFTSFFLMSHLLCKSTAFRTYFAIARKSERAARGGAARDKSEEMAEKTRHNQSREKMRELTHVNRQRSIVSTAWRRARPRFPNEE